MSQPLRGNDLLCAVRREAGRVMERREFLRFRGQGFAMISGGIGGEVRGIGWERDPAPGRFHPGVFAVRLATGTVFVASGGNEASGARQWEILTGKNC